MTTGSLSPDTGTSTVTDRLLRDVISLADDLAFTGGTPSTRNEPSLEGRTDQRSVDLNRSAFELGFQKALDPADNRCPPFEPKIDRRRHAFANLDLLVAGAKPSADARRLPFSGPRILELVAAVRLGLRP